MSHKTTFEISANIEHAKEIYTSYKQWLNTYFTKALLEDIQLMMGDQVKLKNLINRRTLFSENSEWYVKRDEEPQSCDISDIQGNNQLIGDKDAQVFFVNGVLTPKVVAIHQQQQLAKLVQQPVSLIYNPTKHVIADLLECHLDRHGLSSNIMAFAVDCIKHALGSHNKKILLVGYSQGAIIVSAALQALKQETQDYDLSRLHYVTFGAGVKQSILPGEVKQEHFVNLHDPVPHLGLLHPDYKVSGKVYERDNWGHLFVADYLNPMASGEFGGDSLFEKHYLV